MIDRVSAKYMALIKSVTTMDAEDMGAVRLALRMALEELAGQQQIGATAAKPLAVPLPVPVPVAVEAAPVREKKSSAPPAQANRNERFGFRFQGSDEELRERLIEAVRKMADELGRTPSRQEWDRKCQNLGLLSAGGFQNRIGLRWSELLTEAGLPLNINFAANFAAKPSDKEDKAESAESTFRGGAERG